MDDPAADPLYRDPTLASFYDVANGWAADFDFCQHLADGAASVLDLGCGTGQLAAALAGRRRVVAVDPAAAMLDIARARPGGAAVEWVEADARRLALGDRFDLVVLTGHTFQVFLTDSDQWAVLRVIAAHLAPGGRFVFDSRNPRHRSWEGRDRRSTTHRITHPELGPCEAWNQAFFDDQTGILTYVNGYRVLATGREHAAEARIRYTPQPDLAARIAEAGLAVERWLGDWQGGPYDPEAREIIPLGYHA
ncbi:MAG: class I SAM-dependent methyltransferase [Azospirillaceae bacterium]